MTSAESTSYCGRLGFSGGCFDNLIFEISLGHNGITSVQSREIEKLDCILSKRATKPRIYEGTSTNACVRIYV